MLTPFQEKVQTALKNLDEVESCSRITFFLDDNVEDTEKEIAERLEPFTKDGYWFVIRRFHDGPTKTISFACSRTDLDKSNINPYFTKAMPHDP